jgi:hypothetical protein
MKTKSSLESAFFNPRALIGFGFSAIGLLLGLVAFITLPTQSALAGPAACTEVAFNTSGGPSGSILVSMESHSIGFPNSPCTIYFTWSVGTPPDPTHSSSTYSSPQAVGQGTQKTFRAFGHKTNAMPEDSDITEVEVVNGGP